MSQAKPEVGRAETCSLYTNKQLQDEKPAPGVRTAVLVVHGMGQQRKFETLSMVAGGIESVDGVEVAQKRVRNVHIGDDEHVFSRMELELKDGRGVDLYEAYWAPITEGEVTLRDVMMFLVRGAFHGIRNSDKTFRRWVFGEHREFEYVPSTQRRLILTLATILSLVFLNAFMLCLIARKAIESGPAWLASPALLNDFMAMVLMFFAVAAGFGAVYLAAGRQRKKNQSLKEYLPVSRLGLQYVIATAIYTCSL